MGTSIPKQYLSIQDKPVIVHTIERFRSVFADIEVVVVISEEHSSIWNKISEGLNVITVFGGEQRFHSIKNGLEKCTGDLIAIHDAVRPFVSDLVIEETFEKAQVVGASIPVIPVKSSLRKITFDESQAVPRGAFRIVQTPQVFKANVIKLAYEQPFHLSFTDDATVVEEYEQDIALVEGNEENIKITTPFDLKIAEALIKL